jgi:excisionase family DNA binding protein
MVPRTDAIARIALSIADVVGLTGIGRTKIYEAIRDGELPLVKIGKRSLVLDEDVRSWLRRHRVGGLDHSNPAVDAAEPGPGPPAATSSTAPALAKRPKQRDQQTPASAV